MSTYGYIRVSTQISDTRANNQTFDRQLKILHDNGVIDGNIFKERISGGVSTTERPEWEKLLQVVKSGDMIIVSEMSRLARSLTDLINTVNHLISMNVGSINEVVKNDYNGYLVNPGDYDEFLKRLLEVKSDKSKIESYGKKSRKIIDDNYNIDDYVEKIISIYDK